MTKFYFLIFAFVVCFTSCKSVSKSYQKGDYADAVEIGVKKLNKDPNDAETRELVKSAYEKEVAQHEEQVRILSNSKSDSRFESIFNEYDHLQKLYRAITQYPVVANMIPAKSYADYLQTYGEKAADVHIAAAERYESENSKLAFRKAYYEYSSALRFLPNDGDLKRRRDEVYNLAITKVLVTPIRNYNGFYNTSFQLQNFQNEIMRTLSFGINNEFVKFYSDFDLRSSNQDPDEIMELDLGRINVGRAYDERSTREVSKEVVIKETVYKPDSVVKQYGTVKAVITTTKRTLLSEGDLYVTVTDPQGRIIWNDRFTGQYRWQIQFTRYTGDERALSENDKAELGRNKYYDTPSEDEIMGSLFRQIQNDLSYRLRNYYSSY